MDGTLDATAWGTIVVGGGTAGAVVAGRLAESGDRVLLLEAGPDYGPREGGRWPADLLDASRMPESHQWGLNSGRTYHDRVVSFPTARVLGGCSAHNGCAAIWGSRIDYDGWARLGNYGWSTEELLPFFQEAHRRLRVRIFDREELTPFQRGLVEAAPSVGIPIVDDLNDIDQNLGASGNPANIVDGLRWNASFAYLDPLRKTGSLRVVGDALVDRVLLRGAGEGRGTTKQDLERNDPTGGMAHKQHRLAGQTRYGDDIVDLRGDRARRGIWKVEAVLAPLDPYDAKAPRQKGRDLLPRLTVIESGVKDDDYRAGTVVEGAHIGAVRGGGVDHEWIVDATEGQPCHGVLTAGPLRVREARRRHEAGKRVRSLIRPVRRLLSITPSL